MFKIFGRHYGAQRFFIMLFLCLAVLISMGIYGGHVQHQKNLKRVSDTALYTTTFTWSRTGDPGEVVGMITDTNHTKAFLLLKNPSTSSVDAMKYECFLTGRDAPITNNPSLTTYVFGSTGYVGFYFVDARGFASQIYDLIIRDDSSASEMANDGTGTGGSNGSFNAHNQIELFLNFAAKGTTVADVMNTSNPQPLAILADLPIKFGGQDGTVTGLFESYKKTAQTDLDLMSTDLRSIYQYQTTLHDLGVVVPDLPYYIAGDMIDTHPNDFTKEPMRFDEAMAESSEQSSGSHYLDYGDGSATPESPDATATPEGGYTTGDMAGATYMDGDTELPYYYLHTMYLNPGCVSFNWQGQLMSNGLISQVYKEYPTGTPLNRMYMDYSEWKATSEAQYSYAMPTQITYDSWRKSDGSFVDMSTGSANDTSTVQGLILAYEKALNDYLLKRVDYFKQLDGMLQLENKVQALGETISSNNGVNWQNLWIIK